MNTIHYTNKDKQRFEKRRIKSDDSECHLYNGAHDKAGHGKFKIGSKTVVPAHRFAYLAAHNKHTTDLPVIHTCGNNGCINPAHLKEGRRPGRPRNI